MKDATNHTLTMQLLPALLKPGVIRQFIKAPSELSSEGAFIILSNNIYRTWTFAGSNLTYALSPTL